jgi:hypothetical protein
MVEKNAPYREMIIDPVEGWFAGTEQGRANWPSKDKACDKVPARVPEVNKIEKLAPNPLLRLQRTIVVEIHALASVAEPDTLDWIEWPNDMLEPKMVKVELPVTGPLCWLMRRETQMQLEAFALSLLLTLLTKVRLEIFCILLTDGTPETFDRMDEFVTLLSMLLTDGTPETFDRMDELVTFVIFWHIQVWP